MKIDYETRQRLINAVLFKAGGHDCLDDDSLRRLILLTVAEEYAGSQTTFQDRKEIASSLFSAMRGLDILQPLMDDPDVTEIMVNGPDSVFIEKDGQLQSSDLKFSSKTHLTNVITSFFGRANRMINEKKPLADMRLPGGERVHAALSPAALNGPVLTIRKFTGIRPDMDTLIERNFISQAAADMLINAVRQKKNIFISGGTGTGKTTFLNILSGYIPQDERVVTIEDAAELSLQGIPNLVRLECRQSGPKGDGEISLTELIRAALRMRPDRIIVGEVRGKEAFDMLQAMNTGHPGSLCTGHGNTCRDMLNRLSLMVMLAMQLPWYTVNELISSSIDLIIQLSRSVKGLRQITEISRVLPAAEGQYTLDPIFRRIEGGELLDVECDFEGYFFEQLEKE
ncbi:MAG TPA: pilus assembly protein [Clostridiales bacterium]|nr:pilus assembly protein [Clostridiales bacterium]